VDDLQLCAPTQSQPPRLEAMLSGLGGFMGDELAAAPREAPLELKLEVMLRSWSYP